MSKEWRQRIASSWLSFTVVASTTICVIIVLLGCGYNNLGLKYTRSTKAGLVAEYRCEKELFILSIKDSQLCCDVSYHDMDWVCVAAFDKINKLLSSNAAFYLPFLPFAVTCISDAIRAYHERFYSTTNVADLKKHFRRAALYVSIIAYRTVSIFHSPLNTAQLCGRVSLTLIQLNFLFFAANSLFGWRLYSAIRSAT